MELLHKTVLVNGYMSDGMSVKMFKTKSDIYKVYMYVHCEDLHEEVGEYNSYNEAINELNDIESRWN